MEYSVHCISLACFGVPHRQAARSSVRQSKTRTFLLLSRSVSLLFRRAVPRRLPAAGTTTLKILRNGKETREIHKIAARSRPIPAGAWDLQTRIYPSRFTPGPHLEAKSRCHSITSSLKWVGCVEREGRRLVTGGGGGGWTQKKGRFETNLKQRHRAMRE
ncbi:hypothetical protein CSIM01_08900 [Colletotrichum simmondsii]|uniref:Uncharacterized protein n=1 Tax=Colletotrichum simmondsii TaxID=703756 RepID=A0A135SHI3_9PEZI|nr:hypothetical protein CSIM01_08900 [Colletotrichum simmondsii]